MNFKFNNAKLKPLRQTLRRQQTDAERKLWGVIRDRRLNGHKFYRQYSVGNYILDFYCPEKKLAIELDGGQHDEEEQKRADAIRTAYLNERGIKVIRFWNNEVLKNIDGVGEVIIKFLTPS
jgi:very-short-patch-repair endonuclease